MPSLSIKEIKAKLGIAAKKFNYELLNLVTIQYEMEKLDAIRQQQVIEIDEMYDKVEDFKELIEYLTILSAKNHKGNETAIKMIRRLKAELECKQDLIIQAEFETDEIFSDLYYKRIDALSELRFKETKLEKLGVSKTKIDEIKESNNFGQSSWWNCFNN